MVFVVVGLLSATVMVLNFLVAITTGSCDETILTCFLLTIVTGCLLAVELTNERELSAVLTVLAVFDEGN